MNFKKLLADDDAVSPVIGVILMVAITVILAAVIGTFVLGLGDQVQQTSPNTQISTEQSQVTIVDDDATPQSAEFVEVELSHDGGTKLQEEQISVTVNGNQAYGVDQGSAQFVALWNSDGEISAGSSVKVVAANSSDMHNQGYDVTAGGALTLDGETGDNAIGSGDTIRVTWTSSSGDSSSTLREYEVN